jgi:hypothetical protein
MNSLKMTLALVAGLALACLLAVEPAFAGNTGLLKEFVGNAENKNRIGEGDSGAAPACEGAPCFPDNEDNLVAARFANSVNTIAEGPPPGCSDPNVASPNCPDHTQTGSQGERFTATGARQLPTSENSVNGFRTFENVPTCRGDFGIRPGNQAIYSWEIALEETPIVGGEIQVQICLDVRKCQVEDDAKGQAATPGEVALTVNEDLIGAAVIRVRHEAGSFRLDRPFGSERDVTNLVMPSLAEASWENVPSTGLPSGRIRDIKRTDNPNLSPFREMLDESIEFIGKDCTIKWIKNDGMFVREDRIRVELSIPSSINVRVRAAQDSAAVCYLALVGE